jgi:hypothetical protein
LEIRLKSCLLALALSALPLAALANDPAPRPAASAAAAMPASQAAASGAAAAASVACPGRSAPSLVTHRITSKARHTVDDGDPCADPHSPPVRR